MDTGKSIEKTPELVPGVNTHENVIVPCVGGFSNTGMTSFFGSLEAVKALGLRTVSDVCITSIPLHIATVDAKIKAAKKIIAVDGCANMCAKKLLEKEGYKIAAHIVLDRDIGMKKVPFSSVLDKNIMEILKDEEIQKAKDLIISKIR